MKIVERIYQREDSDVGVWGLIPMQAKDVATRRVVMRALFADGCPRRLVKEILRCSEPTISRDIAAIRQADPDFGSPQWRAAYLERAAAEARRHLMQDDADLEAMGN